MILIALLAAALASKTIVLDAGPVPVERAFALKTAKGDAAFAAEVDGAITRLRDRAEDTGRCVSPAEAAAAAQLKLVEHTSDAESFTRSRTAAEAALAQRRELRTQYLDGAQAPPPYGLVGRMAARAKTEPNPRLAQLYRRMAEDQFSRIDSETLKPFFGPGVHTAWEKGLDQAALTYVAETIESEWCANDVANAAWLKADVRAHGWYNISTYGAEADTAAWSIVQHGRHDRAFEAKVLVMLDPLWRSGETKGQNYAALYDQLAEFEKRPGRFGINGECTAPGVWTPAVLEGDRPATDAWRAKAGMAPLAEYIAIRSKGCAQ